MGCKNGTDLLYHCAKYGGDRGSRAGCRRKSMMFCCLFFYRQSCAKRSHAGIAFTQSSKNGFSPRDNGKIWHAEQTAGPLLQTSGLSGQKCTAPKTTKFSPFDHKFASQGRLVCPIFTKFSAFVRVSR